MISVLILILAVVLCVAFCFAVGYFEGRRSERDARPRRPFEHGPRVNPPWGEK